MKIKLSECAATLAAVNGKAVEHTYSQRDLQRVAARAEEQLEQLGLLVRERPGATVQALSGGKVSSAYKYPRKLTSVKLERTSSGWWLTDCRADNGREGHEALVLTVAQDAAAVAHLRKGYRHA
jgi:hypothetical protein